MSYRKNTIHQGGAIPHTKGVINKLYIPHKQTVYFAKTTNTFEKDTPVAWDADITKYLRECDQVTGILNKEIF